MFCVKMWMSVASEGPVSSFLVVWYVLWICIFEEPTLYYFVVADFFYAWTRSVILVPTNELKIPLYNIRKQLLYRGKLGLSVKQLIITITNIAILGGLIHTWIHDSTISSHLPLPESLPRQNFTLMRCWSPSADNPLGFPLVIFIILLT